MWITLLTAQWWIFFCQAAAARCDARRPLGPSVRLVVYTEKKVVTNAGMRITRRYHRPEIFSPFASAKKIQTNKNWVRVLLKSTEEACYLITIRLGPDWAASYQNNNRLLHPLSKWPMFAEGEALGPWALLACRGRLLFVTYPFADFTVGLLIASHMSDNR